MWPKQSEILALLTKIISPKVPFKWEESQEQAFQKIKKAMAKETLLAFLNFFKEFTIHTDASKAQLGAVISQEGRPIAFHSRKLNPAQTRCTVAECELLSIAETLKEFHSILHG